VQGVNVELYVKYVFITNNNNVTMSHMTYRAIYNYVTDSWVGPGNFAVYEQKHDVYWREWHNTILKYLPSLMALENKQCQRYIN